MDVVIILFALIFAFLILRSLLTITVEGEKRLLDMWVGGTGLANVRIGLYKNNVTITDAKVLGDFTLADFSGYAVATPAFGAATTIGGIGGITDAAARTFTHNGGGTANTIYGYIVYDVTAGKMLWAEPFASSQSMANNGDQISITAQFTLASQ